MPTNSAATIRALLWTCAFLFAAVTGTAADPQFQFQGVMWEDGKQSVALRRDASSPSQWFRVGQKYEGYLISRVENEGGTLVLAKDGRELRLTLMQSTLKIGGGEPPPAVRSAIMNNLRMLSAASDQYFLENGTNRATFDDIVGPTKYVKEIKAVAGEEYRSLRFEQGKGIEVRTQQGFVIRYDL